MKVKLKLFKDKTWNNFSHYSLNCVKYPHVGHSAGLGCRRGQIFVWEKFRKLLLGASQHIEMLNWKGPTPSF